MGGKKRKNTLSPIEEWNVMVESLKTYRQSTGKNDYIVHDYVIPSTCTFPLHLHGIKLGEVMNETRKAYQNEELSQTEIDTLEQYQIHWDYEAYQLKFLTLPALDMYKKIRGHVRVVVNPHFVIPSEQMWPENLWGVKLGVQVMNWRKQKDTLPLHVVQALDERNFIWDVFEEDFQTITTPALKTYQELKGNLLIPRSFRVPATSLWPKITHGHKLGFAVHYLRSHQGIDTAREKTLDAMKFIWDPIRYRFETRMLPACKIYVQQKGDLNTILESFKVPRTSDLYPKESRGYGLGQILHDWRANGARPDLLKEIEALGFKPDPISFFQRDLKRLLKGLKWFQTTFGYKERVRTYKKTSTCLPYDHPTLPALALGELFRRAKTWDEKVGFSNADRKELKVFASWNTVYRSTIYPLMALYFKEYGNLDIPAIFPVPSCSPWPTWSWKQKLGNQVPSIRAGSISLSEEEKDILESMDFKWGPKGRTPQRESKRHKAK